MPSFTYMDDPTVDTAQEVDELKGLLAVVRFADGAKQNRWEELVASLTNHSPNGRQIDSIEELRAIAKTYGSLIIRDTPMSREQSLALTKLEESVMWAVKAIVLPR